MSKTNIEKELKNGLFFIDEVKKQIDDSRLQDAKNKIDLAMAFFESAKRHIEKMINEVKENRFADLG